MAAKPQKDFPGKQSSMLDDFDATLAKRLRAARLARKWSLDEMAARSGVSRAMVHRVETGRSSPTASLLGKMSGALKISIPMLFGPDEAQGASRIVRAQDRPTWRDPQSGFLREQINAVDTGPGADTPGLGLTRICLPPGAGVDYPSAAFEFIRQAVWVVEGTLHFTEGDTVHVLHKDDCLTLGAPMECRFDNRSDAPCTYVVAVA